MVPTLTGVVDLEFQSLRLWQHPLFRKTVSGGVLWIYISGFISSADSIGAFAFHRQDA